MEGNDLGSLTRIEVIRNGTLAKTFNAPAKGAELSFDDIMDKEGQVHYVVAPTMSMARVWRPCFPHGSAWASPDPLRNLAIARTEKDGEVHLTWKPITFDNRGIAINPAKVTYNIYRIQGGERIDVTKGLTATSHTYSPVKAGRSGVRTVRYLRPDERRTRLSFLYGSHPRGNTLQGHGGVRTA